jgi:hypothetical protein
MIHLSSLELYNVAVVALAALLVFGAMEAGRLSKSERDRSERLAASARREKDRKARQ